jgi:hypothetical protein
MEHRQCPQILASPVMEYQAALHHISNGRKVGIPVCIFDAFRSCGRAACVCQGKNIFLVPCLCFKIRPALATMLLIVIQALKYSFIERTA